jgi:hypothetical protein
MGMRSSAGKLICAAAIALGACDDQFDFDTEPTDGQASDASIAGDAPDEVSADGVSVSDGLAEADVSRPPGRIVCGANTCVLPNRACCVRATGPACIEVLEVDCLGLLIHCDSSNDCRAGTICCATIADAAVNSVRCVAPVDCAGPGQTELCDPSDPDACATCMPAADPLPAGYHVCK